MIMKNAFKSLKNWLMMSLAAGGLTSGLFVPQTAKGWQDYISLDNQIINQGDGRGDGLSIGHKSDATEGYGVWDKTYVFPAPWAGQWAPKIITKVEGHELERDLRFTNSVSKFETDLIAVIQDSQSISGTTRLGIKIYDDSIYDYFDPKRHYTAEYKIYSNFRDNGVEFVEIKNLRDLCPSANTTYEWTGPQNFVVNTETNGEFKTGKMTVECGWNQLVSTKTGPGTNSFEGIETVDYETDRNVTLTANAGSYIDKYIVTRTDNTGCVSVVTNDIAGTDVVSTNVPFNDIKGSNRLDAVYAELPPVTWDLTVESSHGGASPGTTNDVLNGTTLEQKIVNSPVSLGEGLRAVADGGVVVGNNYTQNNSTNITIDGSGLTNNATLTWNWDTQALFTASANANGSVSGNTSNWYDVASGSTATVHAIPSQDYYFSSWTGTASKQNPLEVVVKSPLNVAANFKKKPSFTNAVPGNSITLHLDDLDVGQQYHIQKATNLLETPVAWSNVYDFSASDSSTNITLGTEDSSSGFYRLNFEAK